MRTTEYLLCVEETSTFCLFMQMWDPWTDKSTAGINKNDSDGTTTSSIYISHH